MSKHHQTMNADSKSFGVLGLGLSGIATADFLIKRNLKFIAWDDSAAARKQCSSDTLVSDDPKLWGNLDYLILSPGISLYFPAPHPLVKIAREHNVKIICDLELFYMIYPEHLYIGISGTNGKSTTSALIHHMLLECGISSQLTGNIGIPILSVTPNPGDIIVIEASSYQLDLINSLKFDVAVLLNITTDHLDHHGSMERYVQAKLNLFRNHDKESTAVISVDNEVTQEIAKKLSNVVGFSSKSKIQNGVSIINNTIYDDIRHITLPLPDNNSLRGQHNAENIVASYAAVMALLNHCHRGESLDPHLLAAISNFEGLPHRIQYLGTANNIEFINDSKGTNAESTEKALVMFDNIYWIVGGLPKAGGIESLGPILQSKIKHAFVIGAAVQEFAQTLNKYSIKYTIAGTLENAFNLALAQALQDKDREKKTLLLSPACASLDQWKNFEERGSFFIKLVKKYLSKNACN